jgi:hypothetical protein
MLYAFIPPAYPALVVVVVVPLLIWTTVQTVEDEESTG